jgi:hypothetical protein
MPGAQRTRGFVQRKHEVVHRLAGFTPAFPAQWFCGFLRLSPVTGLIATVALEKLASRELDASVGASGPHDFAVRVPRGTSSRSLSSIAPRAQR